MKITDFYTGFEDEPEVRLTLIKNNTVINLLKLWQGYFDFIFLSSQPDEIGYHGLSLVYHTDRYYEESPWQIPNLSECITDLKNIDLSEEDEETNQVRDKIIKMLQKALDEGLKVIIEAD